MQTRILVIGSGEHNRADCVDWLQPFPNIEEYDSVVINMQSLDQEIYDKIPDKIRGMREPVSTIFNTNRETFCIMSGQISPSPPPIRPGEPHFKSIRAGYVPPTNYDWVPIRIDVNCEKTGTSMIICDHRFDKYFEFVDRWNFEISISPGTLGEIVGSVMHSIYPIAENKSQKAIAGSLKRVTLDGKALKGNERSAIHLLPPPTKSSTSQLIELLLDLVLGQETKITPPWRKGIEVPKERELEKEIEYKIKRIQEIQGEISQLNAEIRNWDSYRDLFTSTGDDLENIVQKALDDMGIKTNRTERGFPADLISKEVAVEVTGIKGCVGVSSEKVNQTGRFKESYHKGEKIVLIANTYIDLPLAERKGKRDFSEEVGKYFESLSVCCLSTRTLFQLWKDVIAGKKDLKDIKCKILTKNGELTLVNLGRNSLSGINNLI